VHGSGLISTASKLIRSRGSKTDSRLFNSLSRIN
jgi:hypothetical protein